jgi:peptide/nickel transport system permease protein
VTAPILVIASIWLGNAILIEATLSFLGLGTQPPTP